MPSKEDMIYDDIQELKRDTSKMSETLSQINTTLAKIDITLNFVQKDVETIKADTKDLCADTMRELCVSQGYVPNTCIMPGEMIFALVHKEDPCNGCNMDRNTCKGRPKKY